MAGGKSNEPLIIKKGKKGGDHGHHGGAWKVAYADFVTAMMAFFLLLWLLNATNEEQKKGIADFFSPSSTVSRMNSGGDVVFGGQTAASAQAQIGQTGIMVKLPGAQASGPPPEEVESRPTQEDIERKLAEQEEKRFSEAETELRAAIQSVPELQKLAQNLLIDRTQEGLRIQIVDQDGMPMFPSGSSDMPAHTRNLMGQIAKIVQKLPNKIAVSGHTDAKPYASERGYSNWELSSDRANASRRALMDAGLPPQRIARVVGKAETEPMIEKNPLDPRNRRISVVLLREGGTQARADAAGGAAKVN